MPVQEVLQKPLTPLFTPLSQTSPLPVFVTPLPQYWPVSESTDWQLALHLVHVGVPYRHELSVNVLPSSHASFPIERTPSPHTLPVSESCAVQVELHLVHVAEPYGQAVSVTVLASSHASTPW